jgi:hypothetical protein
LTRWSTRPDRTLSDRALCLLRRSLFAPTARAFLATWCFLLGLRATVGICASAVPPFSATIRSVSLLAIATLWAIPRHMPACVAHQTRAGCDDKAKNAFQGPRGLYISESLCSIFGLSATLALWVLATTTRAVFCSSAREFSRVQVCVAIHIILKMSQRSVHPAEQPANS